MKFNSVDVKGLQLVRRDNTPYVREVCKKLLDVLLDEAGQDPHRTAGRIVCQSALCLLDGEVPMDKLVLSQNLAASYKSTTLAHVHVRDKMRERLPGSEPRSGDRVPYVIVATDRKKDRQFEKAEDPVWVKEHNVPLDYDYYFTNKFRQPVMDLLEPIFPPGIASSLFDVLAKRKLGHRKQRTLISREDINRQVVRAIENLWQKTTKEKNSEHEVDRRVRDGGTEPRVQKRARTLYDMCGVRS